MNQEWEDQRRREKAFGRKCNVIIGVNSRVGDNAVGGVVGKFGVSGMNENRIELIKSYTEKIFGVRNKF